MRISSLFGRGGARGGVAPPDYFDVDGGTVYAIGDVHGEVDLLKGLLAKVRADIGSSRTPDPKTLVMMGDYVDRGADSRGVLEMLASLQIPGCEIVFLRGNHEQQMLDFVDDPVEKRRWLDWGGLQTLASFGIPALFPTASEDQLNRVADAFAAELGEIRSFVEEKTVLWHQIGNVIFSHGGMKPGIDIREQEARTMLWGSPSFMEHGGPEGYWHVHGHVIHEQPGIIGNRIAVDTGAYDTGVLTVARITDDGCSFLQHS